MGKDTGTSGFECQCRCKPYSASAEEITVTAEDAGSFNARTRIEILRKELSDGRTTYRGSVRERNKERAYVNYLSETALRTIYAGRLADYTPRRNHTGNTGRVARAGVRLQNRQSELGGSTQDRRSIIDRPRVEIMVGQQPTIMAKSDEEITDTGNSVPLQL